MFEQILKISDLAGSDDSSISMDLVCPCRFFDLQSVESSFSGVTSLSRNRGSQRRSNKATYDRHKPPLSKNIIDYL